VAGVAALAALAALACAGGDGTPGACPPRSDFHSVLPGGLSDVVFRT